MRQARRLSDGSVTDSTAPTVRAAAASTSSTRSASTGSVSTSTVSPGSVSTSTALPLDRRTVLRAGALVGAAAAGSAALCGPVGAAGAAGVVFRHGVASGDPMADRVVLWTRVTPSPEAVPGSGVGPAVTVGWEVAVDPGFTSIVRAGSVVTDAGRDHTVKFDCTGLAPDRWYHYRFRALGQTSPVGRTRTAPADGVMAGRARFALVSCSNWEAGYFAAYRHLAARADLDAVIEVGDYIYEYRTGEFAGKDAVIRPHSPTHEIVTLADYRTRLGQYHTDPDLQALHAHVPWICTWDDHETANDSWAGGAENHTEGDWATRKQASAQAYFEWMPVRPDSLRDGGTLYRRLRFGALAEITMLDLRSYRSEQVGMTDGRAIDDPGRTMTGAAQFDWLARGLRSSTAHWNVIGNSVMFSPVLVPPLDPRTTGALTELLGLPRQGVPYNPDQWDGYAAERRRLIELLRSAEVSDVVFLTGDIHSSWACDVPVDPAAYPGAGIAATEFVGTSVTSKNIDDYLRLPEGNPLSLAAQEAIRGLNHHVRWVDLDRHGYVVVEFTAEFAHADYWVLSAKEDPAATAHRVAGWRVRHGRPGLEPAGPLP